MSKANNQIMYKKKNTCLVPLSNSTSVSNAAFDLNAYCFGSSTRSNELTRKQSRLQITIEDVLLMSQNLFPLKLECHFTELSLKMFDELLDVKHSSDGVYCIILKNNFCFCMDMLRIIRCKMYRSNFYDFTL